MAITTMETPTADASRTRRLTRVHKDRIFALALVLPTLLAVIGVSIYPVGYAIWTSLHNVNPSLGMNKWVGFDNYRLILKDDNSKRLFG